MKIEYDNKVKELKDLLNEKKSSSSEISFLKNENDLLKTENQNLYLKYDSVVNELKIVKKNNAQYKTLLSVLGKGMFSIYYNLTR